MNSDLTKNRDGFFSSGIYCTFSSARIIAIIVTRKVICLLSLGLFPKKTISSFKSNFLSDIVMHNLYRYSSSGPDKKTALNELTANAKVGHGFFF